MVLLMVMDLVKLAVELVHFADCCVFIGGGGESGGGLS